MSRYLTSKYVLVQKTTVSVFLFYLRLESILLGNNKTLQTHGSLILLTPVRVVLFPYQANAFYDAFYVLLANVTPGRFLCGTPYLANFGVSMISWFHDIPNSEKKNGSAIFTTFVRVLDTRSLHSVRKPFYCTGIVSFLLKNQIFHWN